MNQFAIFATLMIVVVAIFILPPLWLGLRAPKIQANRKETNLSIFRDQLAELDREKQAGTLAESDFDQGRQELQRRLLDEIEPDTADSVATSQPSYAPSRKMAIGVLLLLPVLALVGYSVLGNQKALDPMQTVAQPKMTPEQIGAMVDRLAAKMKENPDDMQGWLMLGRSYRTLGRFDDAVQAYAHAEKEINDNPEQLAIYAETIAMAGGKGLAGKPRQLVERALKIDPNHAHSLFLAGAAAMETGNNKQGIAYWEALLPQVEPGSEIEQMLRNGLDKMKQAK